MYMHQNVGYLHGSRWMIIAITCIIMQPLVGIIQPGLVPLTSPISSRSSLLSGEVNNMKDGMYKGIKIFVSSLPG